MFLFGIGVSLVTLVINTQSTSTIPKAESNLRDPASYLGQQLIITINDRIKAIIASCFLVICKLYWKKKNFEQTTRWISFWSSALEQYACSWFRSKYFGQELLESALIDDENSRICTLANIKKEVRAWDTLLVLFYVIFGLKLFLFRVKSISRQSKLKPEENPGMLALCHIFCVVLNGLVVNWFCFLLLSL